MNKYFKSTHSNEYEYSQCEVNSNLFEYLKKILKFKNLNIQLCIRMNFEYIRMNNE